MKLFLKLFAILLLAVLPVSLIAQNSTIVLNYMKVSPGMEDDYRKIEMEWKKLNEKKIESGLMTGWQLWQNVYATGDDPYEYITIDWYKDWGHSLAGDPENFWDDYVLALFTEEEATSIWEMTLKSRTMVNKEVMHLAVTADNNGTAPVILVNRMKVIPGMEGEYMNFEREFSKPLQEANIKEGQMSWWGVWQAWPYELGQIRYITVDGYESIEQMTGERKNLLPTVHPDLTWGEVQKKLASQRTQASVELWVLVDSVFPPAPEE